MTLQQIIRIPHSIADGISLMIIVNSLLRQYDNLVETSEELALPKPASQLQPVVKKEFVDSFKERYHRLKSTTTHLLFVFLFRDLINFKNTAPHSLVGNRDGGSDLTTGCGTQEGAENLLSYCRAN